MSGANLVLGADARVLACRSLKQLHNDGGELDVFNNGEDALVGRLGEDLLRVLQAGEEHWQGMVDEDRPLSAEAGDQHGDRLTRFAENL